MNMRIQLGLQLAATLLILAFVPGNVGKLSAFLVVWALSFGRLSKPEAVFVFLVCLFFTGMNAASLQQGIFVFTHPDVLGMPIYELLMWGFYLLHTKRMLGGPTPQGRRPLIWTLTALYSLAFATIPDATLLLFVTGALLAIALFLYHEPLDLAYTGYMIALGAAIEYTGVWSGQWQYPGSPPGGVPLWFITLWGGVGWFLRRLMLPILARFEGQRS